MNRLTLTCRGLSHAFAKTQVLAIILLPIPALAQSGFTYQAVLDEGSIDYGNCFGAGSADLSGQVINISVEWNPANFKLDKGSKDTYDYFLGSKQATFRFAITVGGASVVVAGNQTGSGVISGGPDFQNMQYNRMFIASQTLQESSDVQFYLPQSEPNVVSPTYLPLGAGHGETEFTCPGSFGDNFSFTFSQPLAVISPYLLAPGGLANIDLNSILNTNPNLASASAIGIDADGTAAAIVLVQTSVSGDVTLTSNDGATLLAYNPAFMTLSPTAGATSLTVHASDLIQVDSTYYAAAILQAPQPSEASYLSPITVTSQQSGESPLTQTVPLQPPPIILVHGLWGDSTSLSYYESNILSTAPWSLYPNLLWSSIYNGDIAFDDPGSLSLFGTELSTIISDMQTAGVVGGRVDVVAHSMGGLLTRSYTTGLKSGPCDSGSTKSLPYRSLSDRCQGQFHTIITLDTPEDGSTLATYLIKHQKDTINVNSSFIDHALWERFCKSASLTITVAECFQVRERPVTAGAVASLIPMNKSLNAAPPPDIPNAIWLAVTATNGGGVENTLLQRFIDASNPKSDKIKLRQILRGPNDDIVSLASQMAGQPAGSVTFTDLAHTDIFKQGASVTNSPLVLNQVTCWLMDPATPSCSQGLLNQRVQDK